METHQWLTFQYAPKVSMLWAKLGEAFSKNQHLAGIPLPPALANALASVVLTKGALATTAIEGNALSEEDVDAIINRGHRLPASQEYLEVEIRNIVKALAVIDESGRQGNGFRLSEAWIKEQNASVLQGLEHDGHVAPGEYTTTNLIVGNIYRGAPPEELDFLMSKLCSWLNEAFIAPSQDKSQSDDMRFYNAVFAALLAHLYLVWIHPFGDGNGRTARLVEVAILAHSGVVPWIASNLLSDFYNRTRTRYYERLAAASRENDLDGFILYAVEGYVDMLREHIDTVKAHQVRIAWINYVHERLRNEPSGPTKERRRDLVLALPIDEETPKKSMRHLTTRIAEMYAGREDRTIARDLNALEKLGLVVKRKGGYIPCAFIMNAFMPLQQYSPELPN
nr:Fic family protein [Devriesea agamarum]